ncbi:MAG: hypothetical protein JOZ42_06045 [Acetobacteraceae bacterium]|nr:hypothetical protein [Acetobacteraceae bacterium]
MSWLFASGRIVDAILVLTAVEGAFVLWWKRRTGRGPAIAEFLYDLLAGMCLLAALRVALSGAPFGWMALCLAGALAGHLASLRLRWR